MYPLTVIFKKSVNSSIFPGIWKNSFITPIHKNGSKNLINNFRPITIINIFAKIFESIIHNKLFTYLSSFIIDEQHGSLPKKSITTNLLTYKENIIDLQTKMKYILYILMLKKLLIV